MKHFILIISLLLPTVLRAVSAQESSAAIAELIVRQQIIGNIMPPMEIPIDKSIIPQQKIDTISLQVSFNKFGRIDKANTKILQQSGSTTIDRVFLAACNEILLFKKHLKSCPDNSLIIGLKLNVSIIYRQQKESSPIIIREKDIQPTCDDTNNFRYKSQGATKESLIANTTTIWGLETLKFGEAVSKEEYFLQILVK